VNQGKDICLQNLYASTSFIFTTHNSLLGPRTSRQRAADRRWLPKGERWRRSGQQTRQSTAPFPPCVGTWCRQGKTPRPATVSQMLEFHRIIESLRLEKPSKVTKFNHECITSTPAKPCLQVPHPHGF